MPSSGSRTRSCQPMSGRGEEVDLRSRRATNGNLEPSRRERNRQRFAALSGVVVHGEMNAGPLLETAKHVEQVFRLRIAPRPKHADQALGLCAGSGAEFFESNCRLDVVAKDGLAGFHVTAQHTVDAFAQQSFGEGGISCNMVLHELFEIPCPVPVFLAPQARLPCL